MNGPSLDDVSLVAPSFLPDRLGTKNLSDRHSFQDKQNTAPQQECDVEKNPAIPEFPEGGLRAWSVVFGAACLSFATFGWINSYGVFQAYYQENTFKSKSTSSIAWVGSIQYALVFVPAIFTGRILDLGYYNAPLAANSVFYIVSLFLVAECKSYWQVVLCQGVANGLFAGMLFSGTPAVVTHWFNKRRSLAFGVFAVGSSLGGTVMPIVIQRLLVTLSFQWTIRTVAFILSVPVLLGNLLVRPRLPPTNAKGGIFNFAIFLNPAYALCTVIGYDLIYLGMFVPLTYLDVSGQAAGLSPNFTYYLIAIANCASLIGRVSSGFLADKIGALNTMIPFTLVGALMCYVWPFAAAHVTQLVIVSIIYGCAMGAYVSLIPSAPAKMGGMNDAGRRIGMAISWTAVGAVGGTPLAGAIRTASDGFHDVGLYAGSIITLGCLVLLLSRRLALGGWKGKF
ncbi:MFS general substrate transporter [Leucogyrophana mollusca]|uniref:MFS general substrate transporter n=1 Tax=Leucogyrophana mollusca TaxID=85980 RepID=A0ACB8BMV4_9AGAM|nr:MFS general substrate transporter [Leucogyrophana mollusca]